MRSSSVCLTPLPSSPVQSWTGLGWWNKSEPSPDEAAARWPSTDGPGWEERGSSCIPGATQLELGRRGSSRVPGKAGVVAGDTGAHKSPNLSPTTICSFHSNRTCPDMTSAALPRSPGKPCGIGSSRHIGAKGTAAELCFCASRRRLCPVTRPLIWVS